MTDQVHSTEKCSECSHPLVRKSEAYFWACDFAGCMARGREVKLQPPMLSDAALADSGNRTDLAGTGALRDMAPDKGRFDLLPFFGLQEVARHYGDGAEKYSPRNWEKGLPLWGFIDSGDRHCGKLSSGLTDERHDRAWAWNAIGYLETRQRIVRGELPFELTADLHPDTIAQILKEKEEYGSA